MIQSALPMRLKKLPMSANRRCNGRQSEPRCDVRFSNQALMSSYRCLWHFINTDVATIDRKIEW